MGNKNSILATFLGILLLALLATGIAIAADNKKGAEVRKLSIKEAVYLAESNAQNVKMQKIAIERAVVGLTKAKQASSDSGRLGGSTYVQTIVGRDTAELAVRVSEIGLNMEKLNAKALAEKAYFDLLKAEDQIKIAEKALQRVQEQERIVQAKVKAGEAAKSELLNNQVAVLNAQNDLNLIKTSRNNFMLALAKLTGLDYKVQIELTTRDSYKSIGKVDIEAKIQQALLKRPDIIMARESLHLANRKLEIANEFSMAEVDLKAFQTDINEAQLNYQEAVNNISLSIRQSYNMLVTQENALSIYKKSLEAARESYRLASLRYKAGVGTNLDVVQAQLMLAQEETKEIAANYDLIYQQTQFNNLIGESLK